MKKLEDIPKKNIFEVPDGYFDKLPTKIQARTADESAPSWTWSWGLSLKLALPVVVITLAGIFWLRPGPPAIDVRAELATIAPADLQQYLDQNEAVYDTDITTEELLENPDWSNDDVDQLENSVYSGYGATSKEIEQALLDLDN